MLKLLKILVTSLRNFQNLVKSAIGLLLVVAIPKPMKPVGDPKKLSTDIYALCPLQDPRKAYLTRVEPIIINPLLTKEQARFRRGKSTVDHIVLLNQNIEDSFEAKKKTGFVFVDMTAVYMTLS